MSSRPAEPITQAAVLTLLEGMIEQQRVKCLKIARRLVPYLTADDLMNPFDWPKVAENPQFVWEDGLLAGLQSAHAAICAEFAAQPLPNKEP